MNLCFVMANLFLKDLITTSLVKAGANAKEKLKII